MIQLQPHTPISPTQEEADALMASAVQQALDLIRRGVKEHERVCHQGERCQEQRYTALAWLATCLGLNLTLEWPALVVAQQQLAHAYLTKKQEGGPSS